MLDIESFLKGYKPALLYNPNYEYQIYSDQELQQLNEFPSIHINMYNHLYFRSEQLRQEFLKRTKGLDPDSPDHHRETGIALGFPPKAVDFFITTLGKEELDLPRIALNYCGICCITSIDSLIEDVSFLWENVNVSDPDRTPTEIMYKYMGSNEYLRLEYLRLFIRYNDYDSLYQAYMELKKALISQS